MYNTLEVTTKHTGCTLSLGVLHGAAGQLQELLVLAALRQHRAAPGSAPALGAPLVLRLWQVDLQVRKKFFWSDMWIVVV